MWGPREPGNRAFVCCDSHIVLFEEGMLSSSMGVCVMARVCEWCVCLIECM